MERNPMNVIDPKLPPPVPHEVLRDANAFLHWAEGKEGRFELVGGKVVMMVGASKNTPP
jgi:hypothetical protein